MAQNDEMFRLMVSDLCCGNRGTRTGYTAIAGFARLLPIWMKAQEGCDEPEVGYIREAIARAYQNHGIEAALEVAKDYAGALRVNQIASVRTEDITDAEAAEMDFSIDGENTERIAPSDEKMTSFFETYNPLQRLDEVIVEDNLAMTPDEVLEEARANGEDIDAFAERMNTWLRKAMMAT